MALDNSTFLDLHGNIRLRQLANTGQLELVYTNNPEDKRGKDRHVVVVRDERGHVMQDHPLTTAEFRTLVMGMEPRCPAASALRAEHADHYEVGRTGELLEYFEVVSFELRGTSPSVKGKHLDTWDARRSRFARMWNGLDVTDRRRRLAEARAVLFEYHATDAERKVHAVPTLAELAGREHLAPTVISKTVHRR